MSYLETLRGGIQAAKSGKRTLARIQFELATEMDSHCPHGWLWSAWAADSPAQALEFVEVALTRSPGHPLASQFLEVLQALNDYEFKACDTPSCNSTCHEVCGLECDHDQPASDALSSLGLPLVVISKLMTGTPLPSPPAEEQPVDCAEQEDSTDESLDATCDNDLSCTLREDVVLDDDALEVTEPTVLDDEDDVLIDVPESLVCDVAMDDAAACSMEMEVDEDVELEWHTEDEDMATANEAMAVEPRWTDSVEQELDTVAETLNVLDRLEEKAELDSELDSDFDCDFDPTMSDTDDESLESSSSEDRRWWDDAMPVCPSAMDTDEAPPASAATSLEETVWCAAEELQQEVSDATGTDRPMLAEMVEVMPAVSSVEPEDASAQGMDGTESMMAGSMDGPSAASDSHLVRTILAVDDSPTVLKLVSMTLGAAGYEVVTAPNGIDAMKLLATMTPALVLLDVNMPRMDGYKLCKLLKSHDKTRFIPVVMLSGKDGLFDKLRGKLVGCDDYISKPFETADLLRHVARYVPQPTRVTTG